jgi:translation initiation factor IF-3
MFRGREMEHIDLGMNLVKQAINDLSGVGKADDTPKLKWSFYNSEFISYPSASTSLKIQLA